MREPDLRAWIHQTERLMNRMPFGGTYFRAATPSYSDHSVTLADRLAVIGRNLEALADGLRDHVAPEMEQMRSAGYARRDQLRALANNLEALADALRSPTSPRRNMGHPPTPEQQPLYPWCATCGERLVFDFDGWLVHTWQANVEFTDEEYPIIWKPEAA